MWHGGSGALHRVLHCIRSSGSAGVFALRVGNRIPRPDDGMATFVDFMSEGHAGPMWTRSAAMGAVVFAINSALDIWKSFGYI